MDNKKETPETIDETTVDVPTPNKFVTALKRGAAYVKRNALKIAVVGGATTALAVISYKNGQNSVLDYALPPELDYDATEEDDEETVDLSDVLETPED